jgi:hypothetical protein
MRVWGRLRLCAFLLVVLACRHGGPTPHGRLADEDAVYLAVIQSVIQSDLPLLDRTVVHLGRDTIVSDLQHVESELRQLSGGLRLLQDTTGDFLFKSAEAPRDLSASSFSGRVRFVRPDDVGLGSAVASYAISRVAFDTSLAQAIVYLERGKGMGLGSSGAYLVLVRTNGKWMVSASVPSWMA